MTRGVSMSMVVVVFIVIIVIIVIIVAVTVIIVITVVEMRVKIVTEGGDELCLLHVVRELSLSLTLLCKPYCKNKI